MNQPDRSVQETNRLGQRSGVMRCAAPVASAIAWCISKVKINRVSVSPVEGAVEGEAILKQRSVFSAPLIFVGNIVFRFRSVPVQVLGFREWVRWEQQIQKAAGHETSVSISTGLRMPHIPGVPLSETLHTLRDKDQVFELLGRAATALYHLHQTEVELDGQKILLSHGDASVTNLLFDESSGELRWFDFDLRHDLTKDATLRHADDLRALLFTSHRCLSCEVASTCGLERLADQIKLAYPDPQVWKAMQEIVASPWFVFDLFHHAQLPRLK